MGIYEWENGVCRYLEVHPTFLYESVWNTLGLLVLIWFSRKGRRKFDGMLLALYLLWYGFGRGMIEGLRSDSLYLFGLELFGMPVRTSQLLGFASAAAAAGVLIYHLAVKRHTPEELYVNRAETLKLGQETDQDGSNS